MLLYKKSSHMEAGRLFLALFITEDVLEEVVGSWELAKLSKIVEKKKKLLQRLN